MVKTLRPSQAKIVGSEAISCAKLRRGIVCLEIDDGVQVTVWVNPVLALAK